MPNLQDIRHSFPLSTIKTSISSGEFFCVAIILHFLTFHLSFWKSDERFTENQLSILLSSYPEKTRCYFVSIFLRLSQTALDENDQNGILKQTISGCIGRI